MERWGPRLPDLSRILARVKPPDPVTRLNAALEGRYRIESELCADGLATVYLADDLKHQRKVALKVLRLARPARPSCPPRSPNGEVGPSLVDPCVAWLVAFRARFSASSWHSLGKTEVVVSCKALRHKEIAFVAQVDRATAS